MTLEYLGDHMAQYTESIISYFDILGFKTIVDKSIDPEEVARKLRALRRHSATDGDMAELYGSTFTNFSDLVLRTVPVHQTKTGGGGSLFWEIIDLVHVQGELIRSGVLLRGALTIGEIFIQDGIVFGPGLIRAYELESKVALYPRVIVDPVVFEKLKTLPSLSAHSYDEEIGYLRQVLSKDNDGIWYIDYLRAFEAEADSPSKYVALLGSHRDLITKGLENIPHLDSVASKYGWLVNYHNRLIGGFNDDYLKSLGHDKKDLFVLVKSAALPSILENPLS
jgi:hypothetical protein